MAQPDVQTLEKRLKRHPQLAKVAGRIRKNQTLYAFYREKPLLAPLSEEARSFLQDYYNLVKGIKILPRAEQHFVGDGVKAVRQKVRDLQRSEEFNPLHQDLKLVDLVAELYQGVDWFSERISTFSDIPIFSYSLHVSKGKNGKLMYDPTPILKMFFYGRVMEELGFEKSWDFLRARIHDFNSRRYCFDGDKKYAIIREREALKYVQDVANKVNNRELPEPTERGLVYFNAAVQKILSDGYKQFDADKVPETMSSLAYAADSKRRGPISERSRIRALRPELEEMMEHGHSFYKKLGFQPRVTFEYEEQAKYHPEETKLVEGSQPIQQQKPWYQRLSDALRRK